MFAREDFQKISELLSEIKGRFILSINDRPEIRELFAGFDFQDVDVLYSISGKATAAKELIISN